MTTTECERCGCELGRPGSVLVAVAFEAPDGLTLCCPSCPDCSCAGPPRRVAPPEEWNAISEPEFADALVEAAEAKRAWKGRDHNWNEQRFLLGNLAERYLARRLGLDRERLGRGPDGGRDFGVIDVKARPPHLPDLMRKVDSKTWTTWYVLVTVDVDRRRRIIRGHAHIDELRAAPILNVGHGATYTLPRAQLRPGLP